MKNNIALIGFMGTGKSSVGKALAQRLNKEFIEMDKLIEEKAKMTIPEIFKEEGEIRFREYEIEVCKQIAKMQNVVISCGGGVVLNKINIDYLKQSSEIILLEAPAKEILKRIMKDGKEKRPLLNKPNPLKEIQQLLKFRKPFYDAAAELKINTYSKNIEQITQQIIDALKKKEEYTNTPQYIQVENFKEEFTQKKNRNKCFICKNPLRTLKTPQILTCDLCGKQRLTTKQCKRGHFVCDICTISDFEEFLQNILQEKKNYQGKDIKQILDKITTHPLFRPYGKTLIMAITFTILLDIHNKTEKEEQKKANPYGRSTIPRIIIALKRCKMLPTGIKVYYGLNEWIVATGIITAIFLEATPQRTRDIQMTHTIIKQIINSNIINEQEEDAQENKNTIYEKTKFIAQTLSENFHIEIDNDEKSEKM